MPYQRYGGGPQDNRNQGQNTVPSPWANNYPSGASGASGSNLSMNLLGTLMNSSPGSGNMANLATSLVAQALQNKPGGMIIGGNHFGGPMDNQGGNGWNNAPQQRGGYMDQHPRGRDDYRSRGRDHRASSSNSSRRPPFRANNRSRSRSRDRGSRGGSRRDQSDRAPRPPPQKRMRAGSPKDRAPFEIYIGNYPVRFRESDVRNLFQEHGIQVSTIRLKHDGHKVFAFAETTSEEEIQKAIKAMDSKEIHGRRLRVRSSKDKDRKDKQQASETERKKPAPKRELTEDDVTKHLVFAFNNFLDRQANKEGLEDTKKEALEQAKDLLKVAFDIPEDDSLKISRKLELIFLQNNRREIPVPEPQPEIKQEEIKTEEAEEVQEATEEPEEEQQEEEVEEAEEEQEIQEEEKDEESDLVDQLGDVVENLVEESQEAEEISEEQPEEVEEEKPVIEVKTSPRGGGRGRGAGRARRSRGRRGA